MLDPRRLATALLLPLSLSLIAASSHPMQVRDARRVLLTGDIVFKTNSAELELPQSEAALLKVAAAVEALPASSLIRVGVHSDMRGAADYNLAMSQQRAASVARWLARRGVDCQRLIPVGFGESRPISEKRQPTNRRVEIVALAPDADRADGGALGASPCA